jgi:hypothetical protein
MPRSASSLPTAASWLSTADRCRHQVRSWYRQN